MKLIIKTIRTAAFACAVFSLASCSNEDAPSTNSQEDIIPEEYLNISYQGKNYSNVPTAYDENGDFIFLDNEFSKIYEDELAGLNTLSINLVDDSSIEIYKTLDENLQNHGIAAMPISTGNDLQTRTVVSPSQNYLGKVELWDDRNFKDTYWDFGILKATDPYEVNNLNKSFKFNDKCSSLILSNYIPNDSTKELDMGSYTLPYSEATLVFIGYENDGFGGDTYTLFANAGEVKRHERLKGFNDKLSSFKLFYVQKDTYKDEGLNI